MQATQPASTGKKTSPQAAAKGMQFQYRVVSVKKSKAPTGADGDWYKYELQGGRSPITGMRRGSLKEVQEHAKRCADDLNERNWGRGASAWAQRRAKPA